MNRSDGPTQSAILDKLKRECDRCRANIDAHGQLCAKCELRVAAACPGCDMSLPPADCRHCGHCGRVLIGR